MFVSRGRKYIAGGVHERNGILRRNSDIYFDPVFEPYPSQATYIAGWKHEQVLAAECKKERERSAIDWHFGLPNYAGAPLILQHGDKCERRSIRLLIDEYCDRQCHPFMPAHLYRFNCGVFEPPRNLEETTSGRKKMARHADPGWYQPAVISTQVDYEPGHSTVRRDIEEVVNIWAASPSKGRERDHPNRADVVKGR